VAPIAQWFFAASGTTRLAILELLSQRERSVSEIANILDAPLSSVSFHLKVLRESGLIREHRAGRHKYFELSGEVLNSMIGFVHLVSPGRHKGTCPLSCCRA
jgi:ArsR family transcriptional regulator